MNVRGIFGRATRLGRIGRAYGREMATVVRAAGGVVYRAGPGFMLVLLPPGTRFPATVRLRYEKSALDWAGIAVSALTLVALATWPGWRGQARRSVQVWWSRRTKQWVEQDG